MYCSVKLFCRQTFRDVSCIHMWTYLHIRKQVHVTWHGVSDARCRLRFARSVANVALVWRNFVRCYGPRTQDDTRLVLVRVLHLVEWLQVPAFGLWNLLDQGCRTHGTRRSRLSWFFISFLPDQLLCVVNTHTWHRTDCVWISVATKLFTQRKRIFV
jgi:hypothetical protein